MLGSSCVGVKLRCEPKYLDQKRSENEYKHVNEFAQFCHCFLIQRWLSFSHNIVGNRYSVKFLFLGNVLLMSPGRLLP